MTAPERSIPIIEAMPDRAWMWALTLGLVSATGFAPIGLWPAALLAMGLFALLLARTRGWKQALWLGWLFGWAHFTFGNNWIAEAFTYQVNMPILLGWLAVPLLAIYLAVYPALAALTARLLVRRRPGLSFVLVLAGAWVITEWLRSWVFSGYAWNPFGVVLLGSFDRPGLAALSPIMGTYALSGVAVLLGAALILLVAERRWRVGGLVAILIMAGMYWPAGEARVGTLPVTIVQPNIGQDALTDPGEYENSFRKLARLSSRPDRLEGPRLVLWPESGLADYLEEGYPQRYYDRTTALGSPLFARQRIARVIGEQSVLLTGNVDLEIGEDEQGMIRALGARNAVTAVSDQGDLIAGYDKAHLVPYGEYLPMRELLEPLGLSRLVAGSIDFWPGPGPQTMDLGAFGTVSPQICYEIIFSGQVVDRVARPDFIFNPSSEGWFGSFGPPQFVAQARLRAIEEGLPVIRATPSGISAVIDPRGVVRDYLGPDVEGRIDTVIPPAAAPTPFGRLGNILPLCWALAMLAAGIVATRRRRG